MAGDTDENPGGDWAGEVRRVPGSMTVIEEVGGDRRVGQGRKKAGESAAEVEDEGNLEGGREDQATTR